jgi:DNA-binding transcriptional LysR family regulator
MELRQLRDFVTLAEELHYGRAAARLGIDQSPLSRRIKEFEQNLKVLLFARTSRRTQLTRRGEFLLPWARSILGAADEVQRLLQLTPVPRDTVRIALCDDVPTRHLFALLAGFQHLNAGTSISYVERQCARQVEELRAELTDIGFGLFGQSAEGLTAAPLWETRACAVLSRDHALAKEQKLGSDALEPMRIGLIAREASDPILRSSLESLAHHVAQNPNVADAESLKVLLTMVSADACVGIVGPAQAEMIQLVDFVVRPIAHPRACFVTNVIYRERERNDVANALVALVRSARRDDFAVPHERSDSSPQSVRASMR